MYIGIDIGTSSVKTILINEEQKILDSESVAFSISRPYPLWSEQNPQEWWDGVVLTLQKLAKTNPNEMQELQGIGLSGQMHGAVLLDKDNQVLRPAILWNDGRCQAECAELEKLNPNIRKITSNLVMAGFTAPKLLWVKKFENEIFQKTAKIVLPKDYIRFRLTGEFVTEMSDASGTLWLDTQARNWSDTILESQGLTRKHMPRLVEGAESSGEITNEIKELLRCKNKVIVAGGGGDNAATAVGMGIVNPNDTLLSIGTSGVIFNVSDKVNSNPELTVHSFCHALPNMWHTMGVNLAVSSAINWGIETLSNDRTEENLVNNIITLGNEVKRDIPLTALSLENNLNGLPLFLPYLSGERTPCNDSQATGSLVGLTLETTTQKIIYSILEGVAFNFRQSLHCLTTAGAVIKRALTSGGGTQNAYLLDLIASALDIELDITEESTVGGALGAARLAMLATGLNLKQTTKQPKVIRTIKPIKEIQSILDIRYNRYLKIYSSTKEV